MWQRRLDPSQMAAGQERAAVKGWVVPSTKMFGKIVDSFQRLDREAQRL